MEKVYQSNEITCHILPSDPHKRVSEIRLYIISEQTYVLDSNRNINRLQTFHPGYRDYAVTHVSEYAEYRVTHVCA